MGSSLSRRRSPTSQQRTRSEPQCTGRHGTYKQSGKDYQERDGSSLTKLDMMEETKGGLVASQGSGEEAKHRSNMASQGSQDEIKQGSNVAEGNGESEKGSAEVSDVLEEKADSSNNDGKADSRSMLKEDNVDKANSDKTELKEDVKEELEDNKSDNGRTEERTNKNLEENKGNEGKGVEIEKKEVDESSEEKNSHDDEEKEDIEKEKDNDRGKASVTSHGVQVSHGVKSKAPIPDGPSVQWPWKTNATTVPQVLEEVWSEIDDQCQLFPLTRTNVNSKLNGWKVVRLFVSSTFHDFQNEREILVKKVFPELKEWCEKRRITFIECDLRWGVPRDSTTRTVLCTCMEEIDRCHEDTEGEAFFLNMLGERYGWIPSKDDVPDDIAEKYSWIGNASITHMEILHGAYRFCNRNAAFFLREVEGMPDDVRIKFADPTDLGLAQINRLRTKIASRFPDRALTYTCQYDPSDTSSVKLIGLEKFGQDVLEFFKFAIDRKYPAQSTELTPEEQENERQLLYAAHKGQLIFGRARETNTLLEYVTGEGDCGQGQDITKTWHRCLSIQNEGEEEEEEKKEKLDQDKDEEEAEENAKEDRDGEKKKSHPPVAVVAKSGQGKSSLMARFIMEAKQAGLNVFSHMIGCSGDSLSLTKLIGRLCRHILSSDDERIAQLSELNTEDVIRLWRSLLKEYMDSGKQLLIVIDDLTQLQAGNTEWCDWIPASLEGGVYIVLSLVSGHHTMTSIQKQLPSVRFLGLGCLDDGARVAVVENYFAQYNKKLDPQQLGILTRSQGAENALWLALACEELRVFGNFEGLTSLIQSLPDSLEGLVCKILHRLTQEDETCLVEKALCLLECSMKGLTEQEMQCMLGDSETKTPIPKLHWAMVRRTLKPFFRRVSGMCRVECITFFHHAIGGVVRETWLQDASQVDQYNQLMASYYQTWCSRDQSFIAQHTAFHLSKLQDKTQLIKFIQKDKLGRFINRVSMSAYLTNCRCRTMIQTRGPFHTKLFICNFCAMSRNAFGNQAWPNAESCFICGHFVPPNFRKEERNMAYRCQPHSQRGPPNMKSCTVCNRPVMKGKEKPALLCQFCQMGGFPTCCHLGNNRK